MPLSHPLHCCRCVLHALAQAPDAGCPRPPVYLVVRLEGHGTSFAPGHDMFCGRAQNYGRLLTPADMDKGGNVMTNGKGELLEENNTNAKPVHGVEANGKTDGVNGENSHMHANAKQV